MKTLVLTSPLTRGPLVRQTQTLLHKGGFLDSPIDGVYGEDTAAAARRAKWALGYAEAQVNGSAGDLLRDYLSGKKKPSLLMRRRAASRAEQAGKLGRLALAEARKWVGYKESPPATNRTLFGRWYGADGQAWCAMFVSYVLAHVGFKQVDPRSSRWAYCPYIVRDARAGRYGLHTILSMDAVDNALRRGVCVLALYDWDRDGIADHVGFVADVTGIDTFQAIEGNTAVGNDSNGGQVMLRKRNRAQVQTFVRVGS